MNRIQIVIMFRTACAVTGFVLWSLAARPVSAADTPGGRALAGDWTVLIESPRGKFTGDLKVTATAPDGPLRATMKNRLGETEITDIQFVNGEHILTYEMDLRGQTMDVEVVVKVAGDTLDGVLSVGGGMMEMGLQGARVGSEAEMLLKMAVEAEKNPDWRTTVARDAGGNDGENSDGDGGNVNAAVSGRRQRSGREEQDAVKKSFGETDVIVMYGRPSTEDPGHNHIPRTVQDGFIWRMGKGAATKLQVREGSVRFGDVTLGPGRYGLWARKDGINDWKLLVNAKPDVWGTQHRPEADLAVVPFRHETLTEPVTLMAIDIEEEPGGGRLVVSWGEDRLTASFEVLQP